MSWQGISFWIEHNPGLASWVQAVGSVVAIISAFCISFFQSRNQDSVATKLRHQKAEAFYAVASNAVSYANDFAKFSEAVDTYGGFIKNWDLMYLHSLKSSMQSLELVPSHELSTSALVIAHSGLLASVQSLLYGVESCLGSSRVEKNLNSLKIEAAIRSQNLNFYWTNYQDAFLKYKLLKI